MVENLWAGEPSVHVHTVALPFYFITQPVNNTDCHNVFWVGGMFPSIYFQVVDIATFCLTKFKHFYSIFVRLSFDTNTKEYMPLKWAHCLFDSQLFFRFLLYGNFVMSVSITGQIVNSGSQSGWHLAAFALLLFRWNTDNNLRNLSRDIPTEAAHGVWISG